MGYKNRVGSTRRCAGMGEAGLKHSKTPFSSSGIWLLLRASLTHRLTAAEIRRQQLTQQGLIAASQFCPAAHRQPPLLFQERKLFSLVRPGAQVMAGNHQGRGPSLHQVVARGTARQEF